MTMFIMINSTMFIIYHSVYNTAIVDLIPRKKSTSYSLRTEFRQYPRVNTENFKFSFANRLIFNYNLFI
jgi:hypothetical protein